MKPIVSAIAAANLHSNFDNASEYMETNTSEIAIEESGCRVNTTSKMLPGIIESGVIGIQMSGNGLIITKEDITADEYNAVFRTVLSINKSSCWLLGDILCSVTAVGVTSIPQASTRKPCKLQACPAVRSAISC